MRAPWKLIRALVIGASVVGVLLPASAANAEPTLSEIEQQVRQSSADLEKIVERFNKLNEDLKTSQAAAEALATRIAPIEARLNDASVNVNQIAAMAYKGGSLTSVSALLAADSPTSFIDRLTSLDQIAHRHNAEISGFAQSKAQLDAQKKQLDGVLANQRAQQADLTSQRTKIEQDLSRLYELRRKAYGTSTRAATSSVSATPPAVSGRAGTAVRFAYGALGKPYVWGAAGPNGYDCSGLTLASWRAAGVSLPHNAAMQWNTVAHINASSLAPGDLVFYSGLAHVALYVGGGQVIHAPTFGEPVQLASVNMSSPYGYGRIR